MQFKQKYVHSVPTLENHIYLMQKWVAEIQFKEIQQCGLIHGIIIKK